MGVKLDPVDIKRSVDKIRQWINSANRENARYVCVTNVNSIVEAQKNSLLKKITNESDLSVCDGMPLVWLSRCVGIGLKERVYGYALMNEVFHVSEHRNYKHYFYGSTEAVLKDMLKALKARYPKLAICGFCSPPFRQLIQAEKDSIINDISSSGADIVWVGLGYPKQELWMHEFREFIKCPVLIGVGAAFDFFAGSKPQAPKWMQNSGLEWLFRLICEPKRLWRRYLVNNTLFIFLLLKELFFLRSPLKIDDPRQKEV